MATTIASFTRSALSISGACVLCSTVSGSDGGCFADTQRNGEFQTESSRFWEKISSGKIAPDDSADNLAPSELEGDPFDDLPESLVDSVADHLRFLDSVAAVSVGAIDRKIASLAEESLWEVMRDCNYSIRVPETTAGPDGQVICSWDEGRHHLDLDILADGSASFFYRDRLSSEYWIADYSIGKGVPESVSRKLKDFTTISDAG